ncbi:MAG: hypothetical protein JXP34_24690 [Planctomycetes bacterium]|nr:hypothetical protein [Planctomycetota bacterium]
MLDWMERISLIAVAGLILLLGILYLAIGLPSTTPRGAVRAEEVSRTEFERGLTDEKRKAIEDAERKAAAQAATAASGSAPRAPAKKVYRVVTPEIYDRVSTLNAATREAQKAKSEIVENPDGSVRGLRVYDFDDDFLGARLGLEENDLLLSVDGIAISTDPMEARARYLEYKRNLQEGRPIFLDVERHGQVTRITFDIRDLKGIR